MDFWPLALGLFLILSVALLYCEADCSKTVSQAAVTCCFNNLASERHYWEIKGLVREEVSVSRPLSASSIFWQTLPPLCSRSLPDGFPTPATHLRKESPRQQAVVLRSLLPSSLQRDVEGVASWWCNHSLPLLIDSSSFVSHLSRISSGSLFLFGPWLVKNLNVE